MNLTREELWEEFRAWQIFQTPPPEAETAADAWMAEVEAGRADPDDAEAEAAFVAHWEQAHGDAQAEDWEPVTEPPPRRGGADAG